MARRAPLILALDWVAGRHGGISRYVRDLHAALVAEGADPAVVVLGDAHDAPAGVVSAGSHDAPLASRLRAYTRRARELAARSDVVDFHFALYALPALALRRLHGRRVVAHFHGPWADEAVAAGRSRGVRVRRAVERFAYRRADEVVVLSHAFKRVLVERYGVDPWRIAVIPPGVDLDRFSDGDRAAARTLLGLPEDARVAVAVRRLVPRMGLDVLLDAWHAVRAADPTALLLVAGDGPERERLERLAPDGVRFLGRVPESRLADLYRAADVAVCPSRSLEGFGLVVIEALACGTPVVASDVGGLPEVLAPLGRDLLVPPGDAAALARRLLAPLPSRAECRAHAETYRWDVAARRHLELYAGERPRRPRVVYVDHCAQLSGAELGLLRLLPHLREIDRHVVLAEDGPLAARLQEAGVSVEVLAMREAARGLSRLRVTPRSLPLASVVGSALYTIRLARRLRALRPDIVQTESLKAALYGGAAARLARLPLVWHVHDRIADDYLPRPAVRLLRALAPRLPEAVIANSVATLQTIGAGRRVGVINYPIVHRGEIAPGVRDPSRPFTVGIIGRIAPWKGQDVFLRAFARAFPEGDARALVVGSALFGEDDFFERVRAQARELGLDGRVEFTGFVEDVERVLRGLDVLVHASTIPEPFGQVVVQGMAAGLAVVAAGAGGPSEIVTHGDDGVLYPPGDVDALASALRTLARDRDLRQRLGAGGVARARDYAPARIAEKTLRVYRDVLGHAAGAA